MSSPLWYLAGAATIALAAFSYARTLRARHDHKEAKKAVKKARVTFWTEVRILAKRATIAAAGLAAAIYYTSRHL
jgi:hypothetical protein